MGCILFFMMTGKTPFEGPAFLNSIESNTRTAPLPTSYSQELRDLVNTILTRGQANTPSIGQILKTPIIFAELNRIFQDFLPLT
jgi:serine/threonine protein kinase